MSSSDKLERSTSSSDDEVSPTTTKADKNNLALTSVPSKSLYERRKAKLAEKRAIVPSSLQADSLSEIVSQSTWSGKEKAYEDFIYKFSKDELSEIAVALDHFKGTGIALDHISPLNFPLKQLGSTLSTLSNQIYTGTGIVAFRGLNPDDRSIHDNSIIFAAIAAHISEGRGFQNLYNDQLLHMYQPEPEEEAPNYLPFHNDSCEVLALFCIEPSPAGGHGLLVSAAQVYNELAAQRPEVIPILLQSDWPFENLREPGTSTFRPVLFMDSHQPFFYASRISLSGAPRRPRPASLPEVSLEQADALDALHFAAEKHAIDAPYVKGDMIFFNNFAILHGRGEYLDASKASSRHMLRLWLRDRRFPFQIPTMLRWKWNDIYDTLSDREPRWNFDKRRDFDFPEKWKYLITDEGEQGSKTEYRY